MQSLRRAGPTKISFVYPSYAKALEMIWFTVYVHTGVECTWYRWESDLLVQFLLEESHLFAPNKLCQCDLCVVNGYTKKSYQMPQTQLQIVM